MKRLSYWYIFFKKKLNMSLPSPSTSPLNYNKLSPSEQQAWDAPYIVLAQKSQGDLRLLLHSFFSFLHRKTDFYACHHPDDVKVGINVKMGFKEGDAEKMLLASFRQFPLRRLPRMSDIESKQKEKEQEDKKKIEHNSTTETITKTEATSKVSQKDIDNVDANKVEKSERNTTSSKSATVTASKNDNHEIRYTKEGKQVPIGNGGSNFDYNFKWTQTIQEISIALPLPPPQTRAKDLDVIMKRDSIVVRMKTNQRQVLFEGKLKHDIRTDESTWTIEDNLLLLVLDKKQKSWWDTVITSETNNKNIIDTSLIDSTSKISEYDSATQGMIRKILFDQRQERLGLPKSDDILRKEAYERMKKDHEEYNNSSNEDEKFVPPSYPTNLTLGSHNNSVNPIISEGNIPPLPPGVEYIDKNNFPSKLREKQNKE